MENDRHVGQKSGHQARENEHAELSDLTERLAKTRKARQKQEAQVQRGNTSSGLGIAMRLSTELVVGVLVGTGIGWAFDEWLGTAPLFLLLFFLLGVAAGIRNVMRTAAELNAEAASDSQPNGAEGRETQNRPGDHEAPGDREGR